MSRNSAMPLVAAGAVILFLCGGLVTLPMMMAGWQATANAACGLSANLPPIGTPSLPISSPPATPSASSTSTSARPIRAYGPWSDRQVYNAAAIVATGRTNRVPARGWVIAVATAMQESQLRNLANRNVPESLRLPHEGVGRDHDSVGLFQQRTSWGTVAQRMTPGVTARAFYTKLVKVPGWQQMRMTEAAQAVQISGFPEAYQQWEDDATALVAHVLGLPNLDALGAGPPAAPCGPDVYGPVPVGPGGWVQPVRAVIVSPYGPRGGGLHAGVDLGAARGTPIRAAAAGRVITVKCNSSIGCDRDGSSQVSGCGWYVELDNGNGIRTRYCHMNQPPYVTEGQTVVAGQVLGVVGNTGSSSGPHLHFEVHRGVALGARGTNANSVDPVAFMAAAGAKLG